MVAYSASNQPSPFHFPTWRPRELCPPVINIHAYLEENSRFSSILLFRPLAGIELDNITTRSVYS